VFPTGFGRHHIHNGEVLVVTDNVALIIGRVRLQRIVRAGWLAPIERMPRRVLYRVSDVHAALRRLEREHCPPDKAEVLRIRASEWRNGRGRVRKERKLRPTVDDIVLDFSGVDLNGVNL
jgi:DNA-binding transcriptional regulator PaaX